MPIKLKIDLGKLDKTAFYKGAKGTYLDVVLWETPDSQYGDDYRVVQDLPRERRDAGERGAIVGNGKNFGDSAKGNSTRPPKHGATPTKPAPKADDDDSSIPF